MHQVQQDREEQHGYRLVCGPEEDWNGEQQGSDAESNLQHTGVQ